MLLSPFRRCNPSVMIMKKWKELLDHALLATDLIPSLYYCLHKQISVGELFPINACENCKKRKFLISVHIFYTTP